MSLFGTEFRNLVAGALLAAAFSAPTFAKEKLVWGTTSFPPGYITEGPEKGQGYADQLDRFMIKRLPEYDHVRVEFPNWERFLRTMQQGPLVCTSILWYRPPEERDSLKGAYRVSAPNGVFFQHDVVVAKQRQAEFGNETSFAELLKNEKLIFGYDRPYGITFNRILADHVGIENGTELDAIDPLERLERLRRAKNVFVRGGANGVEGMIKMLLKGRVDYILEYEFMIRHYQDKLGLDDKLVSIPVTEVQDKISLLAYACSDTPEGERAIEAINKILVRERDTPEFRKALSLIVPRDNRKKRYWEEFEKALTIIE